jgi:photosystem II stability/assembly factor-like uncharacterized protein
VIQELKMKGFLFVVASVVLLAGCGKVDMNDWQRVNLPQGYSDSHVLSIDAAGDGILIGTYGRGALFSRDNGLNWAVYDTSSGLSWDFILGGDRDGKYIVLATLGDGLNISTDGGDNWERYGYNFFGIEYLYTVGARIRNGTKYIPTADGLVVFDSIFDWRAVTEKEGLASQYLYDMKIKGDTIALGSLHGYSISYDGGSSWMNFSPNGKFTSNKKPACKVRAVEFDGRRLLAGCDDGLFVSTDAGKSWEPLGDQDLSSKFIHDLLLVEEDMLWVATYKEIGALDLGSGEWRLFGEEEGLPGGEISCLGITGKGDLLAGTHHGLFRLSAGVPIPPSERPVEATFVETEEPVHQWMLRPVGPDDQNQKDQTYLYGSTMGGNFRQHQGNEYNNPEGVPLRAVDDGVVVYIDREIGHSVLRCDTRQDSFYVYAHYHHQHEIFKQVGDRVRRGDTIGSIGKKGNVTNEHLHFEVSLSLTDDSNKESHTRNSELWVETLPGTGTISGLLVEPDGSPAQGARIYGVTKPIPTETPFSFAETYKDSVNSDESYGENFVIGDVPAGDYILYTEFDGRRSAVDVSVEADRVTRVRMELR